MGQKIWSWDLSFVGSGHIDALVMVDGGVFCCIWVIRVRFLVWLDSGFQCISHQYVQVTFGIQGVFLS